MFCTDHSDILLSSLAWGIHRQWHDTLFASKMSIYLLILTASTSRHHLQPNQTKLDLGHWRSLIRRMVSVAKLLAKLLLGTTLSVHSQSRNLCNMFFTFGPTIPPLLNPFHGFLTHLPKLPHQFSHLPSKMVSRTLALILDFFLLKSLLEV